MIRNQHARGFAGVIAVCALLWTAAAAGRADAAQIKRTSEKTFDFRSGGEIVVQSKNGRIVIEAWDQPRARVQITRSVRAPDDAQAEALLRDMKADIEVFPGRMTIVSRYPKRKETVGLWDFLGRKVAAMDIHYYLQVPRGTALRLETTNGEIRVLGTTESVHAATMNGDIRMSGATGSIEAETTNGEVELLAVSGNVSGATTNGGIRAQIDSVPRNAKIELSTTNGNLVVSMPATLQAKLKAETTNGKVTSSFSNIVSSAMSSKEIQGSIGGGGNAIISLQTTNGNVRILKNGERDSE